jgi:hypothetical protein
MLRRILQNRLKDECDAINIVYLIHEMKSIPPCSLGMKVIIKKVLAALVVVFCLGVQLSAIVRPNGGRWWPFVDYPMFSSSFQEGATFKVHQLRGIPCNAPHGAHTLTWSMIGFHSYSYWRALREIANNDPAAPKRRAELTRAAVTASPVPLSTLQIWERSAVVTRRGCVPRNPAWKLVGQWLIDDNLALPSH